MKPKTIIATVIATLFVIILLQNTKVVTFQLLFWQIQMSRIVLLLLMLLFGFIVGYIVSGIIRKRKKQQSI